MFGSADMMQISLWREVKSATRRLSDGFITENVQCTKFHARLFSHAL